MYTIKASCIRLKTATTNLLFLISLTGLVVGNMFSVT